LAWKLKVHSLTGRITAKLMHAAFKAVKKNKGAAGVDKQSIAMFEQNLDANLEALLKQLKKRGMYTPKPLRRAYIPKGGGKFRPLGIPSVRDRVAQEVVRRLLEPTWEPTFHEHSYGFRPRRSCHHAIEKVREIAGNGNRWVVDADIKGFFDNISHKLIMRLVCDRVADGNILGILEKFLSSGVMEDGKFIHTNRGTPQGGVISPLLANIVLNVLDHTLTELGYQHVRYADDFVILCRTKTQADKALILVKEIIEDRLGLTLSEEKTRVSSFRDGFDFLGFRLKWRHVTMRPNTMEKLKEKIRGATVRKHNFDAAVVVKLNRVFRGIVNYFVTPWSNMEKLFRALDKWVRMRLRSMKRKRRSLRDNTRLPNRFFERRGLLSLLQLRRQRLQLLVPP
jgi:RNA-directed DNA polymerase